VKTVCCSWTNRGVAFGDGKVFQGQLDGKIVALDAKTAPVVWSIQAEGWEAGFTITSAPLYYDGLLLSGFTGAERGVRGRVKAFDAKTGKLVWTYYTIPAPGEPGSERGPRTTSGRTAAARCGRRRPSIRARLIFFSTSNPVRTSTAGARGATFQRRRSWRSNAKTGAYRWHYQPGCITTCWDYDSAQRRRDVRLTIDGTPAQRHRGGERRDRRPASATPCRRRPARRRSWATSPTRARRAPDRVVRPRRACPSSASNAFTRPRTPRSAPVKPLSRSPS